MTCNNQGIYFSSIVSLIFSQPLFANSSYTDESVSKHKQAYSQVSNQPSPDLNGPNSQFDFLIGRWEVLSKTFHYEQLISETQATWTSRYINNKSMIVDEWKSHPKENEDSQFFMTLRTYSEPLKRWHVTGLQSNQATPAATFLGEWIDHEMHMDATIIVDQGPLQSKVRFYGITKNSFEWEQKMSIDGKTWHTYQTASAHRLE